MKDTLKSARVRERLLKYASNQVILFFASLGMLYVTLLFVLNSSVSSRIIDEAFNQHFKGSIHWKRLNYGPLPWSLEIVGLDIRAENGDSVISADGVRIGRIDLAQLSQGNLHFRELTLFQPKVSLSRVAPDAMANRRRKQERPLNISQVFEALEPQPTSSSGTKLSIQVTKINVINGDFLLTDDTLKIKTSSLFLVNGFFGLEIEPDKSEMSMRFERLGAETFDFGVGEQRDGVFALNWALHNLDLGQFTWRQDQLKLATFVAKLNKDDLKVRDASVQLGGLAGPILSLDLEFETEQLRQYLDQFGVQDINGPVSLRLTGKGPVTAFSGHLDVESRGLDLYGLQTGSLSVHVELEKSRQVRLKQSEIAMWNGSLTLQGQIDLLDGDGALDLTAEGIDIPSLPGMPKVTPFSVSQGHFSLKQSLQFTQLFAPERRLKTEGELNIVRTNPELPLWRNIPIALEAEYSEERLELHRFSTVGPAEQITLNGWFDHGSNTLSARGSVNVLKVDELMQLWRVPLTGNLAFNFDASGQIQEPKVSVSFSNTRLSYDKIRNVSISGKAELAQQVVSVSNLRLSTQSAGVAVLGTVDLKRTAPEFDLSLITENLELGLLGLENGLSGLASVEIDLTGSSSNPAAKLRGRMQDLCIPLGPDRVKVCIDNVKTNSTFSLDKFSLETFTLRDEQWGMVKAYGSGSFVKQSFTGTLDLIDFPLDSMDDLLGGSLDLKGRVDADLSIGGTLNSPIAGGKVEIQDFAYQDYTLGNLTVLLVGNEQNSTIQLLGLDGQRLILKLPIQGQGHPTARVLLKSFKPHEWLPQLKDKALKIELTGRANAEFKDLNFELQRADLELSSYTVNYALENMGIQVRQTEPLRARWDDGDVKIDALAMDVATENFSDGARTKLVDTIRLNVSGDLPRASTFDLQFDGDVLLEGIKPFVKGTFSETQGRGRFVGRLTGPFASPVPELDLIIERLSLTPRSGVVGTLVELKDPLGLKLRVPADGATAGRMVIDRLIKGEKKPVRILRDESIFNLDELTVEFEAFSPNRVRINGRVFDLSVRVPGVLSATINAPELIVEWSKAVGAGGIVKPRLLVGGSIEVQQGTFEQDITGVNQINQDVRNRFIGRSAIKRVSVAERFPILKRLYLDLSVTGDGDFFVRNRVTVLTLDMEIKLAFSQIRGYLYPAPGDRPDEQLKLVGDVTILPDSKLIYARRDFDVNRGIIDFGRGQFMDAELEASRTFTLRSNRGSAGTNTQFDRGSGDVRLEEVNLTARIQQPTRQGVPKISMNLSSNSGASKFDVAMLVLTGSYPEDASGAASAQPAAEVLLAPLLSLVERPLEDTLDIDLSLTPATAGSLFIDIDKMLSRRLRLYSRVFVGDGDDTNPQKFGLEYQINNTVLGEFTSEKTGNFLSTAGRLRLKLEID
ncbi:MAG: hypothetical protein ACPGQS_02095 [Bradymonadia bacterium]